MEKTIIKSDRLNESYIKLKHKTGLTILLYPMKGYSTSFAMFATRYGSIDRTFKTSNENEFLTVPDGVAHYLEHKLFENEDGVDTFELFAKTGASVNAFTSFDKTAYYFSCTDNFNESLKILLNYVQEPYFTEETIQKEQGIIGQEIKMYEDNPDWRVFFNCLENMYEKSAVKVNIAGTLESIAKIDKDILYRCYNTFYNMNNMVLVIAGSFDIDSALEIIDKEIKYSKPVKIEKQLDDEPENIVNSLIEINLPVSQSQFCIGYKLKPISGVDMLRALVQYEVIIEMLVGESSNLYKYFYDTGLISGGNISYEVFCGDGYFALLFQGESGDPKKVLEKINGEIEKRRINGFAEKDFELVKNAEYGRCIRSFSSPDDIAGLMLNSFILKCDVYDKLEIIANLKFDDIKHPLSSIKTDNVTLSIVNHLRKCPNKR